MKKTRIILYLFIFLLVQLVVWLLARNAYRGSAVHPVFTVALQLAGILLFILATRQSHRKGTHLDPKETVESPSIAGPSDKQPLTKSPAPGDPYSDKFLSGLDRKRSPKTFGDQLIRNLSSGLEIMEAVFYCREREDSFKALSVYAIEDADKVAGFKTGEALTGQAVKNTEMTVISEIPPDQRKVFSGLGSSKPMHLYLIPLNNEKVPVGLLEFGTFREVSQENLAGLKNFMTEGGTLLGKLLQPGNG